MLKNLKQGLLVAAMGSMVVGLGAAPAAAVPLPFTIAPASVGSAKAPFVGTDIQGTSDALIRQTGATTQHETGIVLETGFQNNGSPVFFSTSGLTLDWGLLIKFDVDVSGLTFAAGLTGTVTNFSFTMLADVGFDDTLNAAVASTSGGTAPTLTGNTANDKVIAVGAGNSGSAGFTATGGPTFSAQANFILCNGVANQGQLGGVTVAAVGCGTFNAATFFVSPSPFYAFDFSGVIGASGANVGDTVIGTGGNPNNLALNGLAVTTNFVKVPEPATLALFE